MKKTTALTFLCLLVSLTFVARTNADDAIKQQILKLLPQVDTDKDGVISDAEEATVRRQILKRFSRADRDGDGVLSDSEMQVVLRQAARRGNRNTPKAGNSRTNNAQQNPAAAAVLASLGAKSELNIEYKKNTPQQRNKLDFIYPQKKVY
ncbi:MAG TPA: hypothetical protein DCY79_09355 [Planctomycetaceae bacterium]|nr:hypothetical protein [Planctomycetaceae bacterium]